MSQTLTRGGVVVLLLGLLPGAELALSAQNQTTSISGKESADNHRGLSYSAADGHRDGALPGDPVPRVYIAPDDHTDLFWTENEEDYRVMFSAVLDYYLDLADATQQNPLEYQSRWNCDGSYWMWIYELDQSEDEFLRLIERIRSGHISVPLNGLCVCLGGAPAEAVLRGMYYPGHIEREHDLQFELAYLMENQTMPYGVISLWAGSGVKYSWKGICGCASFVPDAWDREHEMYRAEGPDGSRLLMKWYSQLFGSYNVGGYAECHDPAATVTTVTTDAPFNGFGDRYPYDVIGCFGLGGDTFWTWTDICVTVAQEMTDDTRQVIVSNEIDFFQDFEQTHGDGLPIQSCSFGNEWDLHCASLAEVTARVRRAVERLRAAEALAAIASLHDPTFMEGRDAARDLAWMDFGVYWEHDFGMDGYAPDHPRLLQRIEWQRRLADEIDAYVDELLHDGTEALGDLIDSSDEEGRVYAFNPLSWTRTDFADVAWDGPTPVHVVDVASEEETPSQIVESGSQTYVRFLAADVPSVGYRVYEIRAGEGVDFPDAAIVTPVGDGDLAMENDRYRVVVANRGAVTSLIDHAMGDREFAQAIDGYAINDLGPSTGELVVENSGPVSVTLRAEADAPLAHVSRITLFSHNDRIEIENEITEGFEDTLTWKYGFAIAEPETRHEEVGAILRARLLGDGGDYSPRNARYDWLTLNHFADMSGSDGMGVTLSNIDCSFMKLGSSTTQTLDIETPQISVLAGGRRLGSPNGGLPEQGGDTYFRQRFALRSHQGYDPASAMRFALEHQNPLICGQVTGTVGVLPETSYSALSISNPDVLLQALKPAEEGIDDGIIVRFWNLADEPRNAAIDFLAADVVAAKETTHIETNIGCVPLAGGTISAQFARQQMRTFRLRQEGSIVFGDLTGDGVVNVADLLDLFAAWGPCDGCEADFDCSGVVGVADLLILFANWT
jgi:alpha-mannosidase